MSSSHHLLLCCKSKQILFSLNLCLLPSSPNRKPKGTKPKQFSFIPNLESKANIILTKLEKYTQREIQTKTCFEILVFVRLLQSQRKKHFKKHNQDGKRELKVNKAKQNLDIKSFQNLCQQQQLEMLWSGIRSENCFYSFKTFCLENNKWN